MPENSANPPASDSAYYRSTPAELARAHAEMASYSADQRYVYACGALRYVAQEVATARVDTATVAAARYALALAQAARETPIDRTEAI
ncbi:hypothetical protein [Pseudofrankia sp. DC12]|uniref:hypothetical protein n=1 Tax=Pseudofrankia sp. DC12 TaxID=683315 RepID=UPI0005F7D389|nr:hypothetical protein [Pseudofrankia sp. DC12]